MYLISGIGHIENRLGERKSAPGKGRLAQKPSRSDAASSNEHSPDTHHPSTDDDTHIGRKVDTTA